MRHFDYPFDEFLRHYDELHDSGRLQPNSFEHNLGVISSYMSEQVADREERTYKCLRFFGIVSYLVDHLEDFDEGDLGVRGNDESLVSKHVMRAVHHVFTIRTPAEASRTSPEEVIHLAATMRPQQIPGSQEIV